MKQKTATKALRWMAALALVGGMMTAMSATVWASPEAYPLWVGGTQVTSETSSGDGWSFAPAEDDAPATLTLEDYRFTGAGYSDGSNSSPIYWDSSEEALTIELIGENVITATDNPSGEAYYGIYANGSLVFQGAGRLVALGGETECDNNSGIYATKDIRIDECSITGKSYNAGIVADESMDIGENTGSIIAETGDDGKYAIHAENMTVNGGDLYVKCVRDGISVMDTLEIKNGTVTSKVAATSHDVFGIYVKEKNLIVSGGKISIESTAGTHYAVGIYCAAASMDMRGGEISIKSTSDGEAMGIYLYYDADLYMSGGKISVESNGVDLVWGVMTLGKMDMSDGEISVECSGDCFIGLRVDQPFHMDDGKISVKGTSDINSSEKKAYGILWGDESDIQDGEISVECTGAGSRGVWAESDLTVKGGKIVTSGDDCGVAVVRDLTVKGGKIDASGDDCGIGVGVKQDLTVEGGKISANGGDFGVVVEQDLTMNGGKVSAKGKVGIAVYYGNFEVKKGKLEAIGNGDDGVAVSVDDDLINGVGVYVMDGSVTIGDEVTSFLAAGKESAFGEGKLVKNAVSGTGWTNFEGTEGQTCFDVSADGQVLDGYKRVVFPGLPKAQIQPTIWRLGRLGLRLINALNMINGVKKIMTTWNPWQPRTIWTPWWLRR